MVNNHEIEYFLPCPSRQSDTKVSIESTKQLQKEVKDVFTGIWCFGGMFLLQVESDSKPYQVPSGHIAFFGEVISRFGVQHDQQKLKALTNMLPPKTKKELTI